jgi:hypothetical protein
MASRAPPSNVLPFALALLWALGAAGCAGQIADQMPRAATPAVVESGLLALDDPANQRRLAHLLARPEIKLIQQELVAALLDGSLAALGEQERADRVGRITARYTASLMKGFSQEVVPQIAPMSAAMMRGAMSDQNQQLMQRFIGSMVQASIDPVIKSLADADIAGSVSTAMTNELGPAIQKVLRDDLGPGIAQTLSSAEVKRALGDTAHTLGREMILGANEALAQVQESKATQDSSLLGSVSHLAHQGEAATRFLPWILLAAVLGLGVWVVRLLSQTRRYRTAEEQRVETTRVLNEAIRAAEGKPWSGELLTALEGRFADDEEALLRIHAARAARPRRRSSSGAVPAMPASH